MARHWAKEDGTEADDEGVGGVEDMVLGSGWKEKAPERGYRH